LEVKVAVLTISLKVDEKDNEEAKGIPGCQFLSVSNSVEFHGHGSKEDIYRAFSTFMVSLGYVCPELDELIQ
jgi:hypothetical protein